MLGGASGQQNWYAATAAKGDRIMTVVGKILVFLNLVFSLVVGAFAVMDYTARTHWVDAFNTLKARHEVLQGVSNTYKSEADKLAKEKEDFYEKLNKSGVKGLEPASKEQALIAAERAVAMLQSQTKAMDEMRLQIDDLRKREADAKGAVSRYIAMETAMKADVERRQGDSSLIRKTLKDEMDKNMNLTVSMNDMRDAMVQAQIQSRTLKDRNSQLEAQMQDVAKEVLRLRAGGAGGAGVARGTNPPPDNLEGTVRRADGNLVTISLGSDAGLTRGQTLEVFRLGQNPRYIGRIRVVEVTPTQAVGQATGRLTMPIQINDRVASRIMGGP